MAEKVIQGKNKKHTQYLKVQAKIAELEKDIAALGDPNKDYKNPSNYTDRVNKLRTKYNVAGVGQGLNTYMNQLRQEEGQLKKALSSRYIQRAPIGLMNRLLIDSYDKSGIKYSDKNTLGHKINPDYVDSLNPSSEANLKIAEEQKEALRIEKLEEQDRLRGSMTDSEMKTSEEGTWGPSPTWGIGDGVNINITGNKPDYSAERGWYESEINDPNGVRTMEMHGSKGDGNKKWTGEVGNRKLLKISPIQQQLLDAGHTEEGLIKLMDKHAKGDWRKKEKKKRLRIASPMDMD